MKISHFLNLEWKQFFRSSHWQKSIALNILLVFVALYFMATFLAMGIALYPILKEQFPEQDPLIIVSSALFYWWLVELMIRFFFQKLPVMSVKPLLTLPVKRSKVVHYVLGKSVASFINLLPLFAVVPFGVMLIINDYPVGSVLTWILAMVLMTLIMNFLNFIIESFTSETELSYLPVILFVGGLYALNHFQIISLAELSGKAMMAIYHQPIFVLALVLVLVGVYLFNFKVLKQKLYLDSSLKSKVSEVQVANLGWTKRFGDLAPFMQLDLRLIWRNKRTKSSAFLMVFGLLYGLFFYPNPIYQDMPWMFGFVGIFVTGIFMISFGQFIPAWDSSYYKLLMSQNIKYEQYLKSKFTLMAMSVIILFVLSIPYVYFGWKILLAHLAAALYNVGINTHVILLGGSFNRKKIDLSQRAAFNYQGTGAVQWLIGIPLMFLPLAIFGGVYALSSFEIACAVLSVLGIVGVVFHQKMMKFITEKYLESKYKMISAFSQDS